MRPISIALAVLLLVPGSFADELPPVQFIVAADDAAKDEANGVLPFRITVRNNLAQDITFKLHIHFPFGGYDATIEGGAVGDSFSLAAKSEVTYLYRVTFPRRAGRALVDAYLEYATASEAASRYVFIPRVELSLARRFTVTSTADDGEGTLRRAIAIVNAEPECAELPCRIDFNIAGTATNGWQTIAPRTPLPLLEGKDVEIDGTTQSDTNRLGPDVELLGNQLRTGDALEIRADRATVRGLAIGGFPGGGIFYRPRKFNSSFFFESNYIGVDPTGTRAVFNGQRGITVERGVVIDSVIRDNVISGNGRSGIYIDTEINSFIALQPTVRITSNRIGVAAATDAPIGNNASGIFLGNRSEWTRIENNVIAYNSHFGIGIADSGQYHVVFGNRIFRNFGIGIDYGLNGPGTSHIFRNSPLSATVDSARYDAATNTTTVRGRLHHQSWIGTTVDVYLNGDADAEGEQLIGSVSEAPDDSFVFTTTGDHRGKYITVLARGADDATWVETSEFSNAVRVE